MKIKKNVFLKIFVLLAILVSCKTDLLNQNEDDFQFNNSDSKTAIVTFNFKLPNSQNGKTAIPTFNLECYKYLLDSSTEEQDFIQVDNTYLINSLTSGSHTVTVIAYDIYNTKVLKSDSFNFTVESNGRYNYEISLHFIAPDEDNKGSICLPVNVGNFIAKYEIVGETPLGPYSEYISGLEEIYGKKCIKIDDITSSSVNINLYIYENSSNVLVFVYKTQYKINVYANLTVDKWEDFSVNNIVDNVLTFTDAQLKKIISNTVYIRQVTGTTQDSLPEHLPYAGMDGDGSYLKPFNCFSTRTAIAKIKMLLNLAQGSFSDEEITVLVDGDVDIVNNVNLSDSSKSIITVPTYTTLKIMSYGNGFSKITHTSSVDKMKKPFIEVNGKLILDNIEISGIKSEKETDAPVSDEYAIKCSSYSRICVCDKVIVKNNGNPEHPYTDIYLGNNGKIEVLGPILAGSQIGVYSKDANDNLLSHSETAAGKNYQEITVNYSNTLQWLEKYRGQSQTEYASNIFFSYVNPTVTSTELKKYSIGVKNGEVVVGLVKGNNEGNSIFAPDLGISKFEIIFAPYGNTSSPPNCGNYITEITSQGYETNKGGVFIAEPNKNVQFKIQVNAVNGTTITDVTTLNSVNVKVMCHGEEVNSTYYNKTVNNGMIKLELKENLLPEKYQVFISFRDFSVQYSVIYNCPRFFDSGMYPQKYNTADKYIGIYNKEDLISMQGREIKNCYLKLINDIDLGGISWNGFSLYNSTFDGNKKTIKGIRCDNSTFETDNSSGLKKNGGFIQYAEGTSDSSRTTIKNLTVEGKSNKSALLGTGKNVLIEGCTNKIDIKRENSDDSRTISNYGGICCALYGGIIYNCRNYGNIDSNLQKTGCVGGIVGKAFNSDGVSNNYIYQCENFGNMYGPSVSGVVASYSPGGEGVLSFCINHGDLVFYGFSSEECNAKGITNDNCSYCLNMGRFIFDSEHSAPDINNGSGIYPVKQGNGAAGFVYDPHNTMHEITVKGLNIKENTVDYKKFNFNENNFILESPYNNKYDVIEIMNDTSNVIPNAISSVGGAKKPFKIDTYNGEKTITIDFEE